MGKYLPEILTKSSVPKKKDLLMFFKIIKNHWSAHDVYIPENFTEQDIKNRLRLFSKALIFGEESND